MQKGVPVTMALKEAMLCKSTVKFQVAFMLVIMLHTVKCELRVQKAADGGSHKINHNF